MKLPQDDFPLVVLSVSESGCHPEERSEEGSGLVLALFLNAVKAWFCFVILSVSEESDFAFEKSLTPDLQAFGLQNDILSPTPQILRR
ncbi:hypothetical protein [Aminivibrio sp.]|uniref:hypothetical protein n=1 Tax=Aminivibrio sp. TaxID=1872489 RepID=UPI00345EC756